jgi:hypothetical protein
MAVDFLITFMEVENRDKSKKTWNKSSPKIISC